MGEGVSGPTDQASTTIYQNQSNEVKIEEISLVFLMDWMTYYSIGRPT